MRIFLIVVIIIHGLIHSLGFFKAFKIAKIAQLTVYISRPIGVIWLISALLFFTVALLISLKINWWWIPAIVAVLASQILIVYTWHDSKFGTVANLIILVAIILAVGSWSFDRQTNKEISVILSHNQQSQHDTELTEQMISTLPSPVQKWLHNVGIVGKKAIHNVYLKQTGEMKLKPDQKDWSKAEAELVGHRQIHMVQVEYTWCTI